MRYATITPHRSSGTRNPRRRFNLRPLVEVLDSRLLLAAASPPDGLTSQPDVLMMSATANDPRSVTVAYTVEVPGVSSFDVAIYRSATLAFDLGSAIKLADDVVSGSNASPGAHSGVTLALPAAMAPDPAHPFVFTVATGPDSLTSAAHFQKVIIGVVTHGFEFPNAGDPPPWVTDMANYLEKTDNYNYVIPFGWVPESFAPLPGLGVEAGHEVAQMVETALKNPSIVPADAVVDLHFIAHSRGSVVITTAMQQLSNDLPNLPALQGGYWRETLLDPHPSHFLNEAELGHTLDPLSLLAFAAGTVLQTGAHDPRTLMIPARVTELQDYYEHTPMDQLGANSPILFTTENLLNPYGVSRDHGIKLASSTLYNAQSLTAPGMGHSETYNWYIANVLHTLGTNGPFVRSPIDAPLSGTGYDLAATVGSPISNQYVSAFVDPDPTSTPQDFSVTINWGDNTTSRGTVVSSLIEGYEVEGSHTYTKSGTFTTTITVNDIAPNGGGAKVVVHGQVIVGAFAIKAVGSPAGASPFVTLIDTGTCNTLAHFLAYDASFRGGVQVVLGDVNGDGVRDIVTAPISGGNGLVKVFDGRSHKLIRSFRPFPGLGSGINIAVGDVDGDNHADIIIAPGPGGPPLVKVYSGVDGSLLAEVQAGRHCDRGGVRLTVADFNADGLADIKAVTTPGGHAVTQVFDGRALSRQELARRPTPAQQFHEALELIMELTAKDRDRS
jgi:hypothetical protein